MAAELISNGNQLIDIPEVQRLLDYEIMRTPGIQPGEYDERVAICGAVLAAKKAMRDALAKAAAAEGIAVGAEELAAWEPNKQELASIQFGLRRERKRARMLDGLAQYLPSGGADHNKGAPMRWNQKDMLSGTVGFATRVARTSSKGGKAGIVVGPPGSGKTGYISHMVAAAKCNEDPEDPVRVVIIENTQTVMHQMYGSDGRQGLGKFAPHLDAGLRYQELKELGREVVIMPFASFDLLMEAGEMPDADLVVADEADVYAAGSTGENLRAYTADKWLIGCTASPDDATYDLMPHVIYGMDLPEGIHARILAPTTGYVLDVEPEIDPATLPEDPTERRAAIKALRLRAWIEDAKPRIKRVVESGYGVVARCPAGADIEVARQVAEELRGMEVMVENDGSMPPEFVTIRRKIRAMAVGGSAHATPAGKRLQRLAFQRYNDGTVDVFTYTKAIGRGWDGPRTKLFINFDPTPNAREVIQGSGRATRLVFDDAEVAVPATLIDYNDPDMPDQFTCVMALGGDRGQSSLRVGYEQRRDVQLPEVGRGPRYSSLADIGEVATVQVAVIETKVVEHGLAAEASQEPAGPPKEVADFMDFAKVCKYLDVDPPVLERIYRKLGVALDDGLDHELLEALLSYYPHLRPRTVPDAGYTPVDDLIVVLGNPSITNIRSLRRAATPLGVAFERFVIDDGGTRGTFVNDDAANRLLEQFGK